MKAVILAGGLGSRLSEETQLKPKPMVEIGGHPILWHVMKIYSHHGIKDFIICLGYKGYMIKEYFTNYLLHNSDVTLDLRSKSLSVHREYMEPWSITLIDTGTATSTGGRLKRAAPYIGAETFCLTYGDGVSDINIDEVVAFHRSKGQIATVTAVNPPARFGALQIDRGGCVTSFKEKPDDADTWINGGFFVFEPQVIDYIAADDTPLETTPLERLTKAGQLNAYRHTGFWMPMDNLRDKNRLEDLWQSGNAPWKIWD